MRERKLRSAAESLAYKIRTQVKHKNTMRICSPSDLGHLWQGELPLCPRGVHAVLDAKGLRQGLHDVYERLKRNKALPDTYGLGVAVLDGHEESHASYLRHCSGCCREPSTRREAIASSFIIGRLR